MESALQSGESVPPLPSKPLSIFKRANYGFQLWAFKLFVIVALGILRRIKKNHFKKIEPTYTKRYSTRPTLEHRVFIPQDWRTGEHLPLYINVHGGGFSISDAGIDDEFCHYMSNTYRYCIVSLSYRDAPVYPFPTPVHDVAAVMSAVLTDPELPVKRSDVAAGGFSAGGNLVLAASQMEILKGKIKGLVPVYPVVDFSEKVPRVYRRSKTGRPDILERMGKLFDWAYIPTGTNRKDPLLSVIHARRASLPGKIFLVGAEEDVLCEGAEVMANELAVHERGERQDDAASFEKGGIKWKKVLGHQHGFTHVVQKGQEELDRQRVCKELYAEIAAWLQREVYT